MKLAVLVIGDGRDTYLANTVRAISEHVHYPITARLMIDDSGNVEYAHMLDAKYPDYQTDHGGRRGMAGAVQAGFDLALTADPDYVLWVEEDMPFIRDLPIAAAAHALDTNSQVAQMMFKREPDGWSETEAGFGDVLQSTLHYASFSKDHGEYVTHDTIFSLNPCLIPRRVLELGYSTDNEAGMTGKLLGLGYVFGIWGQPGDPAFTACTQAPRTTGWRL